MNTIKLPQSLNVSTQTSVSFVVLLLTILSIFFLHTSSLKQYIKQQVLTLVEFNSGVTSEQIQEVKDYLELNNRVNNESLVSQTSQEAFLEMFPTSSIPQTNPFHDMITFSMNDYSADDAASIVSELSVLSGVKSVIHEEQDLSALTANVRSLRLIGLIISVILSGWAILFVIGSIRSSLQSQKSTIQTMQLVGAKKSFIWQPLRKSTLQKLLTAIAVANSALILLIVGLVIIYPGLLSFLSILKIILSVIIVDLIVLLAVLITTFAELTRYLEQNYYENTVV